MLVQSKLFLAVGDLVQLNSGGPHLTVAGVDDDVVTVCWIVNADAGYGKAAFPHACLRKVSESVSKFEQEAAKR